ncbi:phage portal protein [Falsibacillus albus]|uniref:Phage portal protein n=1 Tax=Falsibacillus albus TaxID=2478915 RepID=A0A3L7JN09_9BACI|nr:phage portal protein [Falsibacillus albus]RLQ89952.1 phage portal protein [Falsibacillus albus]
MANPSIWNRSKKQSEHDYFSTAIFSSRPPAMITEEEALQIPAVKAAVDLISNSISMLPIYLYQQTSDDEIKKITDTRISTLNSISNRNDTGQSMKKKIVQDFLLHGRSFIYRKGTELYHLPAKKVEVKYFTEDSVTVSERKFVYYGYETVTFSEDEVFMIDGSSNGVLIDGGKILTQASGQIDYSSSLLSNAAVPVGILQATSRLTERAIDRLRTSFENLYGGAKKAGRTLILEEGLDYKPLSLKPDELQLTESNKQVISEIARLFNIPESMISASANKYNSLEQNGVQYLQSTLGPILTAIERALDKDLLDDIERQIGYNFRFDTSEILRTTEEQKLKATAEAFNKGLLTFNQAAYRLDLPKEQKDFRLLSIGNVMKYEDGQMVYLNLGPQPNQPEVNSSNGKQAKD